MENISSKKDAFGHCQEPPSPNVLELPLTTTTTSLSLCPKTICCWLRSAPDHANPEPGSDCFPALSIPISAPSLNPHLAGPWQCSYSKAEVTGRLATYPWPRRSFRSAFSGVQEPGRAVRRLHWTLLPRRTDSRRLGQPGASRLLGEWVDEHRERGGVQ